MSFSAYTRRIVNGAWIAACSRELERFRLALGHVETTQQDYLLSLLRRNARTRFGEKHGFSRITSVAQYQERVAPTSYDGLTSYIEAIAHGEDNVLTTNRVRLFQPTSGSTSGTKLIPWTAAVARDFRRGIDPWLATLYKRKPALLTGTAYWSISPPVTALKTHGRMRVGFENDADYLGFLGRKLFSLVSAVPLEVACSRDAVQFRTRTLLSLLAAEDLSLISIWSPTFLTTLLEDFLARPDEILNRMVREGRNKGKRRAEFLNQAFKGPTSGLFERVWPHLSVISCWTHGPSEIYAENLRRYFPNVEIQGKGLVATEGLVSLPFQEGSDPVLAVKSHFFEFQDPNQDRISLSHELVIGNEYRVIITTGAGLYRYPLGDRIRVTGFCKGAPCFRFVGREGLVSDFFGEKLCETFVARITQRLLAQQGVHASFSLLAPVVDPKGDTYYTLFLEADRIPDPAHLTLSLERGLAENFHYAHCRHLGQLSSARLFHVQLASVSAENVFLQEMVSRGIRRGDVKTAALDRHPGWERRFSGVFAA